MLNIVSMDRAGLNNGDLKVKFEFEFNEDSVLPEKSCSVGQKTYLIANGSTAKNITTNKSYEYKDGKWIKVTNTSENETTTKSNKITDNGDYNIPNNDSTGFNDVSVDVAGGSTLFTKETMKLVSKIPNHATMPKGTVYTSNLVILDSKNGEYDANDYGSGNIYFVTPVKKIINAQANNGSFLGITFTPSEDFDGIYDKNNHKYTLTGDVLSADGKVYFMDFEETTTPKVKKYSMYDFAFTIE